MALSKAIAFILAAVPASVLGSPAISTVQPANATTFQPPASAPGGARIFHGKIANGTNDDLMELLHAGNPENYTGFWEIGTKHLVDLGSVRGVPDPNSKERTCCSCFSWDNYQATQIQQWWNSWTPVSSCLQTNNDPEGGFVQLEYEFEIEFETGIGIGLDIADLINAEGSFGVSESYTVSDAYACNVPGNNVGQIWSQQFITWAWMEQQSCTSCGSTNCGSWNGIGGASAPVRNTYQVGCSVGWDKVNCNNCVGCVIYS
ncbi:hypothetical protein NQ176_g3187 [Zarea fungicola]|uniref:Uncharacterized protein n=1 Tax=Zarea fungicola TaxID=93591 RepID=A0ACC1NL56_9HYPO|nr:hypothetical protein NQ176_g3187 [Lecanicillium fungicola]